MKKFFGVAGAAVVLGLSAICCAGGNPEDAPSLPKTSPVTPAAEVRENTIPYTGPADWVYEASDWVLNLYMTHREAEPRGSHGVLLFEGKEIPGNPGEIRALPIGTVQYHGRARGRINPGKDSGWQMKDPLVKPKVLN